MPGSTISLRSGSTSGEITLKNIMDSIETNKTYMEKEFRALNHKISKVLDRVEAVEIKQSEYEKTINFLGDEVNDLKHKFSKLEKSKTAEDTIIRKDLDKLQADSNLTTLTINGIPSTPKENLNLLVLKLAKTAGLADLTENDVEKVYRSKKTNNSDTPATIVLKFKNMATRDSFYNARKKMAKDNITTKDLGLEDNRKIFINEYLSRTTQRIFYLARMKRKELHYQFVWTYHCQIFMRKDKTTDMIKITEVTDLDVL